MIAVIGLESIGDDYRHRLRTRFSDGISPSAYTRLRLAH